MTQLTQLPDNLPVPIDDGGCDHLKGLVLPDFELPSTKGGNVNLSKIKGDVVVYIYPMTGRPDVALPDGWEQIPGARGCTPQSCSFRDHHAELKELNATLFGLSTQSTEYQREASTRLHLPFPLLSDAQLIFANSLKLPMMFVEDLKLIKRTTLICKNGIIEHVFYPVFPPDKNVDHVINWLKNNG
ncbi:MAG: peroxiredoxin [Chloroflexota bacterium]